MCEMCDDPTLTPADMRARTLAMIDDHGWLIQYVEAGENEPAFAYTVGLTGQGLPELQVVGLHVQAAHELLNRAAPLWENHELRLGQTIATGNLTFRLVPHVGPDEVFVAREFYGSKVRVVDLRRVRL